MFNTLSEISHTNSDKRTYQPDEGLHLPVNKVGIEIEMEGIKSTSALNVVSQSGYWKLESDNSLRGTGIELISVPMFGKDIEQALDVVEGFFKKAKYLPTFNARTSLHVHVEVVDLSREELIRFILLYCAVEPLLFNFCEKSRRDNVYCLPVHTVESVKRRTAELITYLEGR